MAKTTKPSKSSPFILGQRRFAKISAIEGIALSHQMQEDVEALRNTSAEERRLIMVRKYRREG